MSTLEVETVGDGDRAAMPLPLPLTVARPFAVTLAAAARPVASQSPISRSRAASIAVQEQRTAVVHLPPHRHAQCTAVRWSAESSADSESGAESEPRCNAASRSDCPAAMAEDIQVAWQ